MKRLFIILLLLVLPGCATTVAPPQSYLPPGGDGEEMVFGARAVHGFYRDKIFISVNGTELLEGDVTLWRLEEHLSGTYQGHQIETFCTTINKGIDSLTKHFCTVYVDERRVARLAF